MIQKLMIWVIVAFIPLWGSAACALLPDRVVIDVGDGYSLHVARPPRVLCADNPFRDAFSASTDTHRTSLLEATTSAGKGSLKQLSPDAKGRLINEQTELLQMLTGTADVFLYMGTLNYGIISCKFIKPDTSFRILCSPVARKAVHPALPRISVRVDFFCAFTTLTNEQRLSLGIKLYHWLQGFKDRDVPVSHLYDMSTLVEIDHDIRGCLSGFQCIFNITP